MKDMSVLFCECAVTTCRATDKALFKCPNSKPVLAEVVPLSRRRLERKVLSTAESVACDLCRWVDRTSAEDGLIDDVRALREYDEKQKTAAKKGRQE